MKMKTQNNKFNIYINKNINIKIYININRLNK